MSWEPRPNVADTPEKFGLEIVRFMTDPHASYDFDDIILFRHIETGVLYYADDSGCSCPTPFERYETLDDLTVLDHSADSWHDFEKLVTEWHDYKMYLDDDSDDEYAVLRTDMLRKAAAALL